MKRHRGFLSQSDDPSRDELEAAVVKLWRELDHARATISNYQEFLRLYVPAPVPKPNRRMSAAEKRDLHARRSAIWRSTGVTLVGLDPHSFHKAKASFAANARKAAGQARAEKMRDQGAKTRASIVESARALRDKGVTRGVNKLVAKKLDLHPDYVRHVLESNDET